MYGHHARCDLYTLLGATNGQVYHCMLDELMASTTIKVNESRFT